MEKIEDIWVVDETYTPPKNSNIVRKEINTRNGDVRFLHEGYVNVPESESNNRFMENLTDYVYLSNNPLLWACSLLAYFIHFGVAPTLILCYFQNKEMWGTPLVFTIIILLTSLIVYGEFSKKGREYIIAIYTYLIMISILILLFYAFSIVPINSFINS